jgi:hypothetical protein
MTKLYQITIPGLSLRVDFPAVRHRLLADFPDVRDVLATTMPGTVQVLFGGEADIDAWLDALSDSVAARRMALRRGHNHGRARTSSAA